MPLRQPLAAGDGMQGFDKLMTPAGVLPGCSHVRGRQRFEARFVADYLQRREK